MPSSKTSHFTQVKFDWLNRPDAHKFDTASNDEYLEYPLPPNGGSVNGNMLKTSHNISVYHARHLYNPEVLGDKFSLGNLSGEFESPILMVGVAFGSNVHHKEFVPKVDIHYGNDRTLFRHAKYFIADAFHDTSKPFSTTYFTLPIESLKLLIGKESTEYLLTKLNILDAPSVLVQSVPYRVNAILKKAASPHLQGRMKLHYAQAKVLEYLCELIEYFEQESGDIQRGDGAEKLAHDLHAYLLNLEGKLPSLTELAETMNQPVQAMNEAFRAEYGLSIHRFMTQQRLEEAHLAIEKTPIALKTLADRLGYSHVNHFIAAFKRQFGYTPGSLRR